MLAAELGLKPAIAAACRDADGRPAAQGITAIGKRLFPQADPGTRTHATYGALNAASQAGMRLRGHLFFKTVVGMWACSNPECKPGQAESRRNIGTLYPQPRYRCDACGSRVLELLHRETCGDVFLGGYAIAKPDAAAWELFPDSPDLEGVPERARLSKDPSTYLLYWPQRSAPVVGKSQGPQWDRGNYRFAFRPSLYAPLLGHVLKPAPAHDRLDVSCNAQAWRRPRLGCA